MRKKIYIFSDVLKQNVQLLYFAIKNTRIYYIFYCVVI